MKPKVKQEVKRRPPFSIRLPEELEIAFRDLAKRNGQTQAECMAEILKGAKWLKSQVKQETP